ncbi:hypothetical protein DM860_002319 [Cuscuta australis]|uniref:G3BP-like protein n=1 Tax=Cuscuta australis TaxID=267555 RepID=A0A328D1N2_9ASTE|nr:hypothetical protein DM860_002319 [Cuscuta australis]
MAAPYSLPVTAAQVGSYFVGQYYQILQHQPEFVHQLYRNASTMIRIDGNAKEAASGMPQIHTLVMSLDYARIELKTAHSLESWNGGVLVMVSGSVHINGFNGKRNFVQTFFLAPQENGYFILNDIFHFIEEEMIIPHHVAYLSQGSMDSKMIHTPTAFQNEVSKYMLGGEIQAREFPLPANIEGNGQSNGYQFAEEQPQKVSEAPKIPEDSYVLQSNGSLQSTMNPPRDYLSPAIEEPFAEPEKHTYASIVAKAPPVQVSNKLAPVSSEWQDVSEPSTRLGSMPSERSGEEVVEEYASVEDEMEVKSVYVKNVPTTMDPSEIEEEFKKFGKLKPDGVAIRTRKDFDACYAFVEFEDMMSVQNAIKASFVEINGHQLYIEGRRPNRNSLYRGRGRGRGKGNYQTDGRVGLGFGVRGGNSHDGGDYRSSSLRGNGFHRQTPRHERAFSYGSRNGHNRSD